MTRSSHQLWNRRRGGAHAQILDRGIKADRFQARPAWPCLNRRGGVYPREDQHSMIVGEARGFSAPSGQMTRKSQTTR